MIKKYKYLTFAPKYEFRHLINGLNLIQGNIIAFPLAEGMAELLSTPKNQALDAVPRHKMKNGCRNM